MEGAFPERMIRHFEQKVLGLIEILKKKKKELQASGSTDCLEVLLVNCTSKGYSGTKLPVKGLDYYLTYVQEIVMYFGYCNCNLNSVQYT